MSVFLVVLRSPWVIALLAGCIAWIAGVFTLKEIHFLLAYGEEGIDLEALIRAEETVAVLLVCFGVILESRETLMRKFQEGLTEEKKHGQLRIDDICMRYGVYLLISGLVMEIVDQIANYMEDWHRFVLLLEVGINLPLNLVAVFLLLRLIYELLLSTRAQVTPVAAD